MGLLRRRKKDETHSQPMPTEPTATSSEWPDSGDDGGAFDVVPRELWPEIDEFTVNAMDDVAGRWNCSIDFDDADGVYSHVYEEEIDVVVGALSDIEGIEHAHQEDREFVFVLTSRDLDFVRSTFLRLMTEQLAADDPAMSFTPPPSEGRRNEPVDYRALAEYYDNEAAARFRQPRAGRREELRDELIAALGSGARVVDVGAGPGRDGEPFLEAGCHYIGVDLAEGNARIAAANRVVVVPGSLFALPIATDSADVVWTMSTLLHVADARFDEAMAEIVRVIRPGGIVAIGLWGGPDREWVNETDRFDPPRFFSQRSRARLRSMLEPFGSVESFETWPAHADWEYQFVVLRTQ